MQFPNSGPGARPGSISRGAPLVISAAAVRPSAQLPTPTPVTEDANTDTNGGADSSSSSNKSGSTAPMPRPVRAPPPVPNRSDRPRYATTSNINTTTTNSTGISTASLPTPDPPAAATPQVVLTPTKTTNYTTTATSTTATSTIATTTSARSVTAKPLTLSPSQMNSTTDVGPPEDNERSTGSSSNATKPGGPSTTTPTSATATTSATAVVPTTARPGVTELGGDDEEVKRRRVELEVQNKEASRQLSVILIKRGISCRLITECGISVASTIKLGIVNKALWIYWRSQPEVLGAELSKVEGVKEGYIYDPLVIRGAAPDCCMGFVLDNLEVQLELADPETCYALFLCLSTLHRETSSIARKPGHVLEDMLGSGAYRIALEKERLYRDRAQLRETEGALIAEKYLYKMRYAVLRDAMSRWCEVVKEMNSNSMQEDKARWRLHADANQELDLQAWYHAKFFDEIYRMNGPFWYRDAILPAYKKSNKVDIVMSAADEAALENVMCSPDTTYGDVASQMYIAQDILSPEEFVLFRRMTLEGASAKRFAIGEKPGLRMFRISFVEGRIFLIWKEIGGNQGIDLSTVVDVFHGITSECLKKQADATLERNCLTVVASAQTLDLCLESQAEREVWETLMCTLVEKEHGILRRGRPQLNKNVFETVGGSDNKEVTL